jgi:hypothetical protein
MAELVLTDLAMIYGDDIFSGQLQSASLELGREVVGNTDITGTTRTFASGKKTAHFSGSGKWIASGQDVDGTWNDMTTAGNMMTVVPGGLTLADHNVSYSMLALPTNYSTGGSVGDVLPFSVSLTAIGNVYRGQHHLSGTSSGYIFGGATQIGAPGASDVVFALVHATAFTGTNYQIIIQSSDNAFTGFGNTLVGSSNAGEYQLAIFAGGDTDDWWRIAVIGTYSSITVEAYLGLQSA